RLQGDWSSDVCSSDLAPVQAPVECPVEPSTALTSPNRPSLERFRVRTRSVHPSCAARNAAALSAASACNSLLRRLITSGGTSPDISAALVSGRLEKEKTCR